MGGVRWTWPIKKDGPVKSSKSIQSDRLVVELTLGYETVGGLLLARDVEKACGAGVDSRLEASSSRRHGCFCGVRSRLGVKTSPELMGLFCGVT